MLAPTSDRDAAPPSDPAPRAPEPARAPPARAPAPLARDVRAAEGDLDNPMICRSID